MTETTPNATWGNVYWPTWFVVVLMTLLGPEIYALCTNVRNTQSYWVWHQIGVSPFATGPWTAVHFLALGVWLVVMGWLTFHFFFGLFR